MALFFDQAWFDAKLAACRLTRADVEKLLNLSGAQVAEIWKDQRELRAAEVAALARLLGAAPAEIALHAGVSTPIPDEASDVNRRLDEMSDRLTRIERMIVEIKALILTPRP